MNDYLIFLYFFAYAFLGWLCESIYVSIGRKKIVNSGFLHIPICPIYGFGAMIVVYLLNPIISNPFLVFILGILATSILEYITSWLMELFFHIRWWDYSKKPFNINGRVCLLNSFLFGIMSVGVMYIVHPFVSKLIESVPTQTQLIIASILFVITAIDFVSSTISVLNLNKSLEKVHHALAELSEESKVIINENLEALAVKVKKRQQHLRNSFPTNIHKQFNINRDALDEFIEKLKKK